MTAFRAPAYCLSAPLHVQQPTRCPKRYAAPTSAHSETPRQPSRASPRSRCSQRGAIPLPARHRDHVRYARNEQRVRDKHQSASMHHLHVKRAFDPRSDCAGKAALHVPSATVRATHAARMPRNHSDAATASAERAGGGVRPESYLCTALGCLSKILEEMEYKVSASFLVRFPGVDPLHMGWGEVGDHHPCPYLTPHMTTATVCAPVARSCDRDLRPTRRHRASQHPKQPKIN